MSVVYNQASLTIASPAFKYKAYIPAKYTCQGQNVNPPLVIAGTPKGTKSLALIVDDPDAPNGTFVHWVVWNITPTEVIKENSIPGSQGKNGAGEVAYKGPCPPTGIHRYFFQVYALDIMLELEDGASKAELEKAMDKHVLATGSLIGLYKKTN